jgi:peptidoglycan/xylan/chitin deacetylase (PgdA/CDA1 family)
MTRLRSSALPVLLLLPALLDLPLGGRPEQPIHLVRIDDSAVALTFDACATHSHLYEFDRPIFETLKREGVPATIFVSGRWVEGHPDAMEELASSPLIEFGDHSYDHPHMPELTTPEMAQQIDETEAALARFGKHSIAFRPPYGELSPDVLTVLAHKGLPPVLWDVVSGDPSAGSTAKSIVHTVVKKTRPGSIIVFHINGRGWKTAEALPSVITELRQRGFRFVHLSEMLAVRPRARLRPPPPPQLPATLSFDTFDPLAPAR